MKTSFTAVVIFISILLISGCAQRVSQEEQMSAELANLMEEGDQGATTEVIAQTEAQPQVAQAPVAGRAVVSARSQQLPAQALQPATPAVPEKPTAEQIQQALKNCNLYQGKIDGNIGTQTKKAIRLFQEQSGLVADGKVGPKTWERLGSHLYDTAPITQNTASTPVSGSAD